MNKNLAPLTIALSMGIATTGVSAMDVWIGGSVGSGLNHTKTMEDPNVNANCWSCFSEFNQISSSNPINFEIGVQPVKVGILGVGVRAGIQFNNPSAIDKVGILFGSTAEYGAEFGGIGYGLIDLSVYLNESTQIGVGVGAGFAEVNYVFRDTVNTLDASAKSFEPSLMTEIFMRSRLSKNTSLNFAYANNRFQSKILDTYNQLNMAMVETKIKPKLSTLRVGVNYHF
jgi:hypothetical protein